MPKYKVTLCDERWYYVDVEVEAANEDEADKKALDLAELAELDWEWTDGRGIEAVVTTRMKDEDTNAQA